MPFKEFIKGKEENIFMSVKEGVDSIMIWLKKIGSYFFDKIQITITPGPDHKIRVFAIRRAVPIIAFLLLMTVIGSLAGLYKYYQYDNQNLAARVAKLEGVLADNQRLKNELLALNQDTERLKDNLSELIEHNEEIKNLIELNDGDQQAANNQVELKLQTISLEQSVYQYGLPIGGGEMGLYYQNVEKLISNTRNNINKLKQELPTQKKDLNKLETSILEYKSLQAATPSIWPLADKGNSFISSNFGWRIDPISRKQEFHDGLDIGVWYNTPVLAAADGTVNFVGWANGYGRLIKIDHDFGIETRYGHLNKIKVNNGQQVKRGQVIGLTGNSGKSTGPHLHYEIRKNNIPQNPRNYIGR